MLNLYQLHHALELARRGTFVKAAEAVNLSQPAFSRSIKALEDHLGVQVFIRRRTGVEVTTDGQIVLERARRLLSQAKDIEQEALLLNQGEAGRLAVMAGPYAAEMVVAPAVQRLLGEFPGVQFRLTVDDWTSTATLIRQHRVDVAVCEVTDFNLSDLVATPLTRHPVYPVVRIDHPLPTDIAHQIHDLLNWPIALTSRIPPRVLGRLIGKSKRLKFRAAVECENVAMIKRIVSGSDAIGFLPISQIERELADGELKVLALNAPWLTTAFSMVTAADRILPRVLQRFMDVVQEVDRQIPAQDADMLTRFGPAAQPSPSNFAARP